jgi:hypothetical protein
MSAAVAMKEKEEIILGIREGVLGDLLLIGV